MHREIQIKQFPIVTTHWWPKTRNERLCEKTNSIYIVFYLLYTTMSKWSECAHASGVWRVCARALAHAAFTRGVGVKLTEGVSETWCWRNFSSANGGVSQSDRLMQYPIPFMQHPEKYVIGCCNYDGASAPRFRHACVSVHVLFPSIETVTYTCHYITDRLERFDIKTSNWIYWRKKDTYILDALGVSW